MKVKLVVSESVELTDDVLESVKAAHPYDDLEFERVDLPQMMTIQEQLDLAEELWLAGRRGEAVVIVSTWACPILVANLAYTYGMMKEDFDLYLLEGRTLVEVDGWVKAR